MPRRIPRSRRHAPPRRRASALPRAARARRNRARGRCTSSCRRASGRRRPGRRARRCRARRRRARRRSARTMRRRGMVGERGHAASTRHATTRRCTTLRSSRLSRALERLVGHDALAPCGELGPADEVAVHEPRAGRGGAHHLAEQRIDLAAASSTRRCSTARSRAPRPSGRLRRYVRHATVDELRDGRARDRHDVAPAALRYGGTPSRLLGRIAAGEHLMEEVVARRRQLGERVLGETPEVEREARVLHVREELAADRCCGARAGCREARTGRASAGCPTRARTARAARPACGSRAGVRRASADARRAAARRRRHR